MRLLLLMDWFFRLPLNRFIPRLSVADRGSFRFVLFERIEIESHSLPYCGNHLWWFISGELSGRTVKIRRII